jgi:hypothetical protein
VRAVVPLLALALAAGCGGEAATVTVTETETVTVTVEASVEDGLAYQLARDLCDAIPAGLLAPFLGAAASDPELLGERFAELVRPELREAAAAGCTEGAGPGPG